MGQKKNTSESAQKKVWQLIKSYFKGVKNESYIENINDKPVLFVIYYDFRPIEEVDCFVQTCLKAFNGSVEYGEVNRKYSDEALRLHYRMGKSLTNFSFI